LAQRRAKDIGEKEEARRRKKAQPVYDWRKQAAEAEDSQARQVLARVTAEQASLAKNPRVQGSQRADAMLELQQSYGNRYVQRVMGKVQAKLIVNPPDDQYEREADRVATAITRVSGGRVRPEQEEAALVRMKAVNSQLPEVSDETESRIKAAQGSGQPLSDSIRASLEPYFGRDFSQVRVHTDAEADALCSELGAKAFTTGHDVFFRQGDYEPDSQIGKNLLGHEIAHVVQQGAARVSRQAAEKEEVAADAKEEAKKELKDDVDKLKTKLEPEYIKDILRIAGNCQAQAMEESAYKWAMEEAAEAASTMLKRKTAALDVKSAKKEIAAQLLKAAADVMKLGGDDKAVESALKKALDWAEAQLASAMSKLKAAPTKANAAELAAKAAQVQLLGGDATKAVEALKTWEEESRKKEQTK
jgi:hypothetical protein